MKSIKLFVNIMTFVTTKTAEKYFIFLTQEYKISTMNHEQLIQNYYDYFIKFRI